jgi:hypothetical protein
MEEEMTGKYIAALKKYSTCEVKKYIPTQKNKETHFNKHENRLQMHY